MQCNIIQITIVTCFFTDLTSEMEEDIEPLELFSELGMLVVEGRIPNSSAKGREEGPHCPYGPGEQRGHMCEALSVLVSTE